MKPTAPGWRVCFQSPSADVPAWPSLTTLTLYAVPEHEACPAWLHDSRRIPMPGLVGEQFDDASRALGDLGLDQVDAFHAHTGERLDEGGWQDLADWQVCRQRPAPGSEVSDTTRPDLWLLGPGVSCTEPSPDPSPTPKPKPKPKPRPEPRPQPSDGTSGGGSGGSAEPVTARPTARAPAAAVPPAVRAAPAVRVAAAAPAGRVSSSDSTALLSAPPRRPATGDRRSASWARTARLGGATTPGDATRLCSYQRAAARPINEGANLSQPSPRSPPQAGRCGRPRVVEGELIVVTDRVRRPDTGDGPAPRRALPRADRPARHRRGSHHAEATLERALLTVDFAYVFRTAFDSATAWGTDIRPVVTAPDCRAAPG
ncbi:hypothetical protein STENM36S_04956 [Streptomyces tendae]